MCILLLNSVLGEINTAVEYSNNHVVVFSMPELMTYSEPRIEPILFVDVAMTDEDLNLFNINPNELVYYYNYSYGGGDYEGDNFCVFDSKAYEGGTLPTKEMYPYKITGFLYKCFEGDSYNIIPSITGTDNFNIQAYSECDYSHINLSKGEEQIINFTYIINYESNIEFFENNGIVETILPENYHNPYVLSDIVTLNLNWLQYTQINNFDFYDSASNCVESSTLKQEFIIPINMSCVDYGVDYLTNETICLYEFNYPNRESYTTNFNKLNNSGAIPNTDIIKDNNEVYSDKLNLIKQQTTNIIKTTSENNYLVIDFLITICEFLVTIILVLYYFILIMVLAFVFTYYVPKIVMAFPNMLYEILRGKRGLK